MKFDKDDMTYIDSLKDESEARAFVAFLWSEYRRHYRDIDAIIDKISETNKRIKEMKGVR